VQYVRTDGLIDPREYLRQLPQLVDALPPGAAAFATNPGHYDLAGPRCVKDLKLDEYVWRRAERIVRIRFAANPWKHDEDLVIEYTGVSDVRFTLHGDATPSESIPDWVGSVVLDELLPAPGGCVHEVAMHAGSLLVSCADLVARWQRAARPGEPPPVAWRPLLQITARGSWLGRHADGTWVAGPPGQDAVPVAEAPIRLVALLEQPWPEVVDRWRTLPQPAPPLDDVLSYALESGTYWGRLALGWLEQGYPISGFMTTLARIKDDRRYGQPDRHRALRLWKRHRPDTPAR
jgi:hypothetical protein